MTEESPQYKLVLDVAINRVDPFKQRIRFIQSTIGTIMPCRAIQRGLGKTDEARTH